MFNLFNTKASLLSTAMLLILLLSGYIAINSIYYSFKLDDNCLVEESVFFPSPDKKWYAKLNTFTCPDSPKKREVSLVRTPNDRVSLLAYSSVYLSKVKMKVVWDRPDLLVISIPDNVKPDFPAKKLAGINVSYSFF